MMGGEVSFVSNRNCWFSRRAVLGQLAWRFGKKVLARRQVVLDIFTD
jgi:hypothetical protein